MQRTQKTPFQEIIKGFNNKFRWRNRLQFPHRGDLKIFLDIAVLDLGKSIRAGETNGGHLLSLLCSVLSRTISLADTFDDLPIIEAMCRKYPLSGCAYCGEKICRKCEPAKRNEIQESPVNKIQMNWSINQWCRHLKNVYWQANYENGLQYSVFRLQEELNEISKSEFMARFATDTSVTDFREEIAREFADVFAWIFGIANILDVELDGRAKAWAFKKCPDCDKSRCDCGTMKFFRALS